MPEDALFKTLCKPQTLRIGWHLAQLDSRDNFLSDPVGYADFALALESRLAHLLEEVQNDRYRPRPVLDVELPKSGLSVRPGTVIPIEEATVLHAIVFLIAPKIDPKLPDNVHSYRLRKDWRKRVKDGKALLTARAKDLPFLKSSTIRLLAPLESWYTAWPEFDRARIKAARESGYTHLTRTDITSYFDNIDLRLLDAQLRSMLPREGRLIQLLMRVFESWTRLTSFGASVGRGIPQGNEVSSFLGNIYLLPLDRALESYCRKHDAVWFRYVDDVEVYSKDYTTARNVVFVVNKRLRALHLNLQGSKTEILTGDRLEEAMASSESETIEAVWNELQEFDCRARANRTRATALLNTLRPITRRFRSHLPGSVHELEGMNSRKFRRLMTVYGRTGRPWLKAAALAALREPPEMRMLGKCLRYLSQMDYSLHGEIADELLSMLEEEIFPIPYQGAMTIEAMRWLHPRDGGKGLVARIRKHALAKKRDWCMRQKAGEAIASLPYREDWAAGLAAQLLSDPHPWVRRAGCVLLTRGPVQVVRDTVEDLVYHPDAGVGRLALLWHRHLNDPEFAITEIKRMQKGALNDQAFIRRLPLMWLIRCNADVQVIKELRKHLVQHATSRSAKIQWHLAKLDRVTEWVARGT